MLKDPSQGLASYGRRTFFDWNLAEIVGILSVDGHPVGDGREGQITRRIREAYSRIVTAEEPRFSSWLTSVW